MLVSFALPLTSGSRIWGQWVPCGRVGPRHHPPTYDPRVECLPFCGALPRNQASLAFPLPPLLEMTADCVLKPRAGPTPRVWGCGARL